MKTLNNYIATYKELLAQGDIRKAYTGLVKYVLSLKAHLARTMGQVYEVGNVSPGYMDYTYFPFFNDALRRKKLRFGLILNHSKVRFELWLLGQNTDTQKKYWDIFKSTRWNEGRTTMPKYSVLEVVLVANPDFDNQDMLTHVIEQEATRCAQEIMDYLDTLALADNAQ